MNRYRTLLLDQLDVDANNFLIATGITDATIKDAINTLVVDLKGFGLWSKMKAIYPFVGGTATTHKFNLKDPRDTAAAFRMDFVGGWTHSANGALPNGVNAYGDMSLVASTHLGLNSTHVSIYSRTNTNKEAPSIANAIGGAANEVSMWLRGTNLTYLRVNNPAQSTVANTDSTGYYIGNRNSSTQLSIFKNNTKTTFNQNSNSLRNNSFQIGAFSSFFDDRQYAFSTIGDGLTDEDSANLYFCVQKFQTTLGRQVGTPIYSSNATDVNARLFLGATNIQDATITSAVDTLVQGLKTDGIWTKLKAVYPFVGGTATTHKFNLANALDEDTAFRLQFNGGLTHSSNGVLGNNFNGYADTFISPSARLNLNDTSVSIYSRTDATNNKGDFGVQQYTPVSSFYLGYLKFTDGKQYYLVNSSTPYGITSTTNTSLGLFTFNRKSSTTQSLYKNGTEIHTMTKNSVALPTNNMYLLGVNSGEFSNKQFAFASIGDGLTPTEAANLYTRVQAFQTTLGRAIV